MPPLLDVYLSSVKIGQSRLLPENIMQDTNHYK